MTTLPSLSTASFAKAVTVVLSKAVLSGVNTTRPSVPHCLTPEALSFCERIGSASPLTSMTESFSSQLRKKLVPSVPTSSPCTLTPEAWRSVRLAAPHCLAPAAFSRLAKRPVKLGVPIGWNERQAMKTPSAPSWRMRIDVGSCEETSTPLAPSSRVPVRLTRWKRTSPWPNPISSSPVAVTAMSNGSARLVPTRIPPAANCATPSSSKRWT